MIQRKKNTRREIKLDGRNARFHDDRNKEAVRDSLKELGAGRSIVIDAEDVIIGGNGVYAEAQSLGLPVRIIESDGSELIAIKRTDLKTDDAKRKALALADNRTSDLSFFDDEKVMELLSEIGEMSLPAGFTEAEKEALQNLGGVIDDLSGNSFANNIKALSDVFSITFVFSKNHGGAVTEYIKLHGKQSLVEHIIEHCRKAVS